MEQLCMGNSALQGCCSLHRKDGALEATPGAHCPSPCLSHAPGLPAVPPLQPQVRGTQQDLAPGAVAGTWQRRRAVGGRAA